MLVAVSMAQLINLLLIIVVVSKGAEYLSRSQIIPLGQNLLNCHAGLIVIINDMPYSYPCPFYSRLFSTDALNFDDMWVGSMLYILFLFSHKAISFVFFVNCNVTTFMF